MASLSGVYRRYTTGLKLQYAAGDLDRKTTRSIPRSTRRRWRALRSDSFFVPDQFDPIDCTSAAVAALLIENRQLHQMLRAAVRLVIIFRQLITGLNLTSASFRPALPQLIRVLHYATANGFRSQLQRCLPFSTKQLAAWNSRKVCKASLANLCRRKHPFQLATGEIAIIKEATTDQSYLYWPLSSIYYQLMRNDKLHCSLSTFYKYCRLLGVTRPRRTGKKKHEPLKAASPLSMLHMDITLFKTADGVKHYLYVIRDNFSRALLACKASVEYSSAIAKETLHEILKQHGLLQKEGRLITDGGAENCGAVTELLARPGVLWKKLVAQVDITQSNSMVEAINKIIKHRYLYRNVIENTEELMKLLPEIIEDYNQMPQACLHGLTPNDVLDGAMPDKGKWTEPIAAARTARLAINQRSACVDSC